MQTKVWMSHGDSPFILLYAAPDLPLIPSTLIDALWSSVPELDHALCKDEHPADKQKWRQTLPLSGQKAGALTAPGGRIPGCFGVIEWVLVIARRTRHR